MASKMGIYGCLAVVALLLHVAAAADTYTVLDNLGWTVPSTGNDSVYRTWVAGKNFKVGDNLFFQFPAGQHNVAEVSKQQYDTCNTTSLLKVESTPPVNITIRTNGQHYYICGVPGHCQGGQKLAITVGNSNGTVTPSGPSPPASPSGSSSSLTVSGFFIFQIFVVFSYVFFLLRQSAFFN